MSGAPSADARTGGTPPADAPTGGTPTGEAALGDAPAARLARLFESAAAAPARHDFFPLLRAVEVPEPARRLGHAGRGRAAWHAGRTERRRRR